MKASKDTTKKEKSPGRSRSRSKEPTGGRPRSRSKDPKAVADAAALGLKRTKSTGAATVKMTVDDALGKYSNCSSTVMLYCSSHVHCENDCMCS